VKLGDIGPSGRMCSYDRRIFVHDRLWRNLRTTSLPNTKNASILTALVAIGGLPLLANIPQNSSDCTGQVV